jgi:hypothetical protein
MKIKQRAKIVFFIQCENYFRIWLTRLTMISTPRILGGTSTILLGSVELTTHVLTPGMPGTPGIPDRPGFPLGPVSPA